LSKTKKKKSWSIVVGGVSRRSKPQFSQAHERGGMDQKVDGER